MKTKMYVMIGISGSGKSTIAQELTQKNNGIVISTDAIREELFGDVNEQKNGGKVFELAYQRIVDNISAGIPVVFDATNTTEKALKQLRKKVNEIWEIAIPIAVVVETPLGISLIRNSQRDRVVPQQVIERQAKQLEASKEKIKNIFENIIYK